MIEVDALVRDEDGELCRVTMVDETGVTVDYGGSHCEDTDFLKHGTYEVIEDIRSMYQQQKQRADQYESLYEKVKDAIVQECSLVDGIPEIGLRHVRDEVGTNENNMKWYEEWNK